MLKGFQRGGIFPCASSTCTCAALWLHPVPLNKEKIVCANCGHGIESHDNFTVSRAFKYIFQKDNIPSGQEDAMEAAVKGHSVALVMPPGHGKSFCYWLPALITKGTQMVIASSDTAVINQLAMLGQLRQPFQFCSLSFNTGFLNYCHAISPATGASIFYLSAKSFRDWCDAGWFSNLASTLGFNRIVLDEPHLLNSDELSLTIQRLLHQAKVNNLPVTISTVQLSEQLMTALEDLQLQVVKPITHLLYAENSADLLAVANLVKKYPSRSGIIYCHESEAVQLQEALQKLNVGNKIALHTVNGLHQFNARWQAEQSVCAILPYGSSVERDRQDIGYIVHWTMPDSLTSYYNQIGRAGRDWERCECLLFYSYEDLSSYLNADSMNEDSRRIFEWCRNNRKCRHFTIMEFKREKPEECNSMCDVCLGPDYFGDYYEDHTKFAIKVCKLLQKYSRARVGIRELVFHYNREIISVGKATPFEKLRLRLKVAFNKVLTCAKFKYLMEELVAQNWLREKRNHSRYLKTTGKSGRFIVLVQAPQQVVQMEL